MNPDLTNIRVDFGKLSLGVILRRLSDIAGRMQLAGEMSELDSIADNYRYMRQYAISDHDDEKRHELYESLKYKAYTVSSRIRAAEIALGNATFRRACESSRKNPLSYDEIEERLNWFYGEIAISKLTPSSVTTADLNSKLFLYRQKIFDNVFSNVALSSGEADALKRYLLSPTVEYADSRLIISAMLLSQQTVFDIRKFRILTEVYSSAADEDIRQLALVVIALTQKEISDDETYIYHKLAPSIMTLVSMPNIHKDLLELQMQVLLCRNTENTRRTIDNDIMPILRGETMAKFKPGGNKSESEILDEMLHPEKEDAALEKIEEGINRMRELQESGADVYYGGFSHTKRFPFFYTLINWFIPFYMEHPQLAQLNFGEITGKTMEALMGMQNFCDSDRYSFCLTLSTVLGHVPKEMLDILKRGEAPQQADRIPRDAAYMRHLYLQDLYRFYNLYSSKGDFENPFGSEDTSLFICGYIFTMVFYQNDEVFSIPRYLYRNGDISMFSRLLDVYEDEDNLTYIKLRALEYREKREYEKSLYWFKRAIEKSPGNIVVERNAAEVAIKIEDYEHALRLYEGILKSQETGKVTSDDEYNYALCLLKMFEAEKALKVLRKLDYLHEDNIRYKTLLAVACVMEKDPKEALDIYASIDEKELSAGQLLRKSAVMWAAGQRQEAVDVLKRYVEKEHPDDSLADSLHSVANGCGLIIKDADLFLLADLASE